MDEVDEVSVLKPDRHTERVQTSTLPEGNRLEYFAVKQFLEIYNRENTTAFHISLLRDAPDVECTEPSGGVLYIEVATIFDRQTDAPKMLGRAEGPGGAREIGEAIRQINNVMASKSTKKYGFPNCTLLLRHGVPIFSGDDFRLSIDDFIIPLSHDFREIYLLAYRQDGGVMHVGQDLIRLFPACPSSYGFPAGLR